MRIFVVRRGDSLGKIAGKSGMSAKRLAELNGLPETSKLYPGQTLLLPAAGRPRQDIELCAHVRDGLGEGSLGGALPYLTFLCPGAYRFEADGGLIPASDGGLLALAYKNAVAPLMRLSNLGSDGAFKSELSHMAFTDMPMQDKLVANISELLCRRDYCGLELNICNAHPFDREGCTAFIKRLSERLHGEGYFLFSTLAPAEAGEGAAELEAYGKYCDRLILMCYDWGYSHSRPQAVSPIDRVRSALDYAVERIAPQKILLGISNCGYNWSLPWSAGTAARALSNTEALRLARANRSEIKFDETAQAPYFFYTEPTGKRHEVWFEDLRSLRAKLSLVSEYKLAGISIRALDYCDAALFNALSSDYGLRKIV